MGLLEVNHLTFSINGHEILRGLDLHVQEGTVHAVVGPNGAGKTTLACTIMGLPGYVPKSGEIRFDGSDITSLPLDERARRGLSLAWQEPARFEGLTVREFLSVGAADKRDESLRQALERVALEPDHYLDRAVDTGLSGGERKRIEVASIVVMNPKLMIFDEPDSGIDVEALNSIFELLVSMRQEGKTVLLVTHSKEVLARADVATLVCCGKDVDEGPADKIQRYFEHKCIPCDVHNPDLVEGK